MLRVLAFSIYFVCLCMCMCSHPPHMNRRKVLMQRLDNCVCVCLHVPYTRIYRGLFVELDNCGTRSGCVGGGGHTLVLRPSDLVGPLPFPHLALPVLLSFQHGTEAISSLL